MPSAVMAPNPASNLSHVSSVLSTANAAAAPLVARASRGMRALLDMVKWNESSYFGEAEVHAKEIVQQLSDPNPETKLEGLRRALAAEAAVATAGEIPTGHFFAEVLKNVSTNDFEVKRLVYVYLLQHAHQHRDLVLLSLNGFQRDLYSRNHVVRSAALKSLSSVPLLEIEQLLLQALQRAAADTSPLVRKTAAHAAAKLYALDDDHKHEILQILLMLLADSEPAVMGAAIISLRMLLLHGKNRDSNINHSYTSTSNTDANIRSSTYSELAGASAYTSGNNDVVNVSVDQEDALAMLHPHYNRILAILPQLQAAPQVVAIDLMCRYCRLFFKKPVERRAQQNTNCQPPDSADFHNQIHARSTAADASVPTKTLQFLAARNNPPQSAAEAKNHGAFGDSGRTAAAAQPPRSHTGMQCADDLIRFKDTLELLLHSSCAAVVAASTSAIYALFPPSCWGCFVVPLLRCMYTSPSDYGEAILCVIEDISIRSPDLFLPHYREFFLRHSDSCPVRQRKLRQLLLLATTRPSCLVPVLQELRVYVHWAGDPMLLRGCFHTLKVLALQQQQAQTYCMRLFTQLLDSPSEAVAAEAVVGIRTLLQQQQEHSQGPSLASLVLHLAAQLPRVHAPAARASVVWIVGRYQSEVAWIAADALRQLARNFKGEADVVKLQILLLALKVWSFHFFNKSGKVNTGLGRDAVTSDPLESSKQQQYLQQQEDERQLLQAPTPADSAHNFDRINSLFGFLCELSMYDRSYDVRDLARLYSQLAAAATEAEKSQDEVGKGNPKHSSLQVFALRYLADLAAPSAAGGCRGLPAAFESASFGGAATAATASGACYEESSSDRASLSNVVSGNPNIFPPNDGVAPSPGSGYMLSSMAHFIGQAVEDSWRLPVYSATDSSPSLRFVPDQEEALREAFSNIRIRPDASSTQQSGQGPKSICSTDVVRTTTAASLMGKTDVRIPLTAHDLDAFYETDTSLPPMQTSTTDIANNVSSMDSNTVGTVHPSGEPAATYGTDNVWSHFGGQDNQEEWDRQQQNDWEQQQQEQQQWKQQTLQQQQGFKGADLVAGEDDESDEDEQRQPQSDHPNPALVQRQERFHELQQGISQTKQSQRDQEQWLPEEVSSNHRDGAADNTPATRDTEGTPFGAVDSASNVEADQEQHRLRDSGWNVVSPPR